MFGIFKTLLAYCERPATLVIMRVKTKILEIDTTATPKSQVREYAQRKNLHLSYFTDI